MWYDVSRTAGVRKLRSHDPSPDPFKQKISPLRKLSSIGSEPKNIHPDPAHTYAISGWGKDLCAGGLLLLIQIRALSVGTLQQSLDHSFTLFRAFCQSTGKTTSISEFSLKVLKIQSFLGPANFLVCVLTHISIHIYEGLVGIVRVYAQGCDSSQVGVARAMIAQ